MSRIDDTDDKLLTKKGGQEFESDEGFMHDAKDQKSHTSSVDHGSLKVPEHLNMCQWAIIAILYLIFAFLAGFIIYISATWNTDRTNEYT